ncbi:MAG: cyclopropane-fatty-acyl-phospholipid synthase family protein [Pseudomonadota bacterium]
MPLLVFVLGRLIRRGDLTVVMPDGRAHRFGGPPLAGVPPVTIRIHDPRTARDLALRPALEAGEAYMDGRLTIEDGSLADFLAIGCANLEHHDRGRPMIQALVRGLGLLDQINPADRARRNVAQHYDLTGRLYDLFLDADRQYSCAYFPRPGMSLEEAQDAKKRHIAAKLRLADGQRVLDIGCGWGGLALALARVARVEVLGITLSREQLDTARRRAAEAGLADRVRFEPADYRHVEGRFDRIVSVGMFEHVGRAHFRAFFRRLGDLLAPDGVALLHSIGRAWGPGATNPWMRKYIFPGGYSPALSEVLPAVERAGLWVTDIEILRLHYAHTIAEWRRRFATHRAEIAELTDERFCRMWEFYLAGAEMAFLHQGHMVFQMQLTRDPLAVPLTRDYMVDAERALAGAEDGLRAAE